MPEVYVSDKPQESSKGAAINKTFSDTKTMVDEVVRRSGEERRSAVGNAYLVCPDKRFVSMQDDEIPVLMLRAHPIVNAQWILATIGLLFIPDLLISVGMFAMVPFKIVFLSKLTWYLVLLGFAFERFLDWYFSVIIVTNERVVDVDFENLLQRVISYATLNHIEEPTVVAGGLLRSLFHYGDLYIATAAEESAIEARNIPFPDRVIRIISELSEELEKRRELGQ